MPSPRSCEPRARLPRRRAAALLAAAALALAACDPRPVDRPLKPAAPPVPQPSSLAAPAA